MESKKSLPLELNVLLNKIVKKHNTGGTFTAKQIQIPVLARKITE